MSFTAFIIFIAYGAASELLMRKWLRDGKISNDGVG